MNANLWLLKHKNAVDPASVTLAIQTLRNTILIAIFIGGFAFQYAWLSLNALTGSITTVTSSINTITVTSINEASQARCYILGVLMFSSFLCWANTIRMASHLGYVIGILPQQSKELEEIKREDLETPSGKGPRHDKLQAIEASIEKNEQMMINMLWSFSLGFRFMFASIPFQFYVGGPVPLIVTTAAMIVFLNSIDHTGSVQLSHTLEGNSHDGAADKKNDRSAI